MTKGWALSRLPWIGGALLVAGIAGVVIGHQQRGSAHAGAHAARTTPAEGSLAAGDMDGVRRIEKSSQTESTELARTMASSTLTTLVSSARAPASAPATIDWERLLERAPETALSRLERALPKDDAEAQRFSVYQIRALASLQRMGEAHARTEAYFERWPSGPDVAFLQSLTGAHPKR